MAKESDKQKLQDARQLIKETSKNVGRASVSVEVRRRFDEELNALRQATVDADIKRIDEIRVAIKTLVDQHLEVNAKSAFREYSESIGLAIVLALILRGFVFEAFKIPSGSMIPTLMIGDHIFVNKFVYGIRIPFTETYVVDFAAPARGEVIVFLFPKETAKEYVAGQPIGARDCIDSRTFEEDKDFIKRVVGVAGDTIEIRKGRLYVNGKMLPRQLLNKERTGAFLEPDRIREFETNGDATYTIQYAKADPDFGPVKVKDGHIFAMGDHRDSSADGRCWGQVPVENIKGRAIFVWMSFSNEGIRWDRLGHVIR